MNRIKATLLKIVGGLKKMLADMFVQYGAMGIPFGFAIMFGSYQLFEGWKMQIGIFVGVAVVLASCYAFGYAVKCRKIEESKTQDRFQNNFNVLIKEIRGLRKDMTKKGNRDEM